MHHGGQTVNYDAVNWRGEDGVWKCKGKIWKFRDLLLIPGRSRLGGQDRGFEALLPKHLENSGENGCPWGERRAWGPRRPQLLPPRYSRDQVPIDPMVPMALSVVTENSCGDTAAR